MADIFDRRKYLLTANLGMTVAAAFLGLLTVTGYVQVWSLLLMTLFMGIGTAMVMPAWQSIIPEVVSKQDLAGGIALNTMGMNISRVLGAFIGGVILAAAGPGVVFLTNAVSFTFIIIVLLRWNRKPLDTALPPEPLFPAVRTGLRYAIHSQPLLFLFTAASAFISLQVSCGRSFPSLPATYWAPMNSGTACSLPLLVWAPLSMPFSCPD